MTGPLEVLLDLLFPPKCVFCGKILDALSIAADQVELENVPAQEALDEAQATAQEALDAL